MKDRTFINSSAEKLCLKLEALEVAKIAISPLKLLAVQVEVNIDSKSKFSLVNGIYFFILFLLLGTMVPYPTAT